MTQDLNHMKTDVALIKKDIKNIEQFFSKFDYIVEMTAERDKNMAVQVEILKGVGEKIEQLDFKIEEHKQDAAKALAVVHDRLEMYRRSSREDHERHDRSAGRTIGQSQCQETSQQIHSAVLGGNE